MKKILSRRQLVKEVDSRLSHSLVNLLIMCLRRQKLELLGGISQFDGVYLFLHNLLFNTSQQLQPSFWCDRCQITKMGDEND